jgi:hypothetical protein
MDGRSGFARKIVRINTVSDYNALHSARAVAKGAIPSKLTAYLETDSFLLVKMESWFNRGRRLQAATLLFSDYRTVDDIMIPFRVDRESAGQKQVFQIKSVQHNLDLDDDHFKLPEQIQKMVDGSAGVK